MKVYSHKETYKHLRFTPHECQKPLGMHSWNSDGSSAKLDCTFGDRRHCFDLTREEALKLVEQLNKFLLDGEK